MKLLNNQVEALYTVQSSLLMQASHVGVTVSLPSILPNTLLLVYEHK